MLNYSKWPNFSPEKLRCQHTGLDNPNEVAFTRLMDKIQMIRTWYGKPMYVTSAYRSPQHPIEARKSKPGQHTIAAIDFSVPTEDRHMIVKKMFEEDFTGIGWSLNGKGGVFIHGDLRHPDKARIWSY